MTKQEDNTFNYLKGLYDKGELTTKNLTLALKNKTITVNVYLDIKAYIAQQKLGE